MEAACGNGYATLRGSTAMMMKHRTYRTDLTTVLRERIVRTVYCYMTATTIRNVNKSKTGQRREITISLYIHVHLYRPFW